MKKVFALETTHHYYAYHLYEIDRYDGDFVFIVNSWGTVTGHRASNFRTSLSIKEFVKHLPNIVRIYVRDGQRWGGNVDVILGLLPVEEDWNEQKPVDFFESFLKEIY